ncbi:MAG: hypothetical protein IT305_33005 [Chloroflexi bacterium]|nr:hypothetical protein [Chloroflexota bacterium]
MPRPRRMTEGITSVVQMFACSVQPAFRTCRAGYHRGVTTLFPTSWHLSGQLRGWLAACAACLVLAGCSAAGTAPAASSTGIVATTTPLAARPTEAARPAAAGKPTVAAKPASGARPTNATTASSASGTSAVSSTASPAARQPAAPKPAAERGSAAPPAPGPATGTRAAVGPTSGSAERSSVPAPSPAQPDALGVASSASAAAAANAADSEAVSLCGAGAILATRAGQRAGKQATIAIPKVAASFQRDVRGQPTFLNDAPYPHHVFSVVIWGRNRAAFQPPPESYQGRPLCVTGTVELYQQRPQIVAESPRQLRVAR